MKHCSPKVIEVGLARRRRLSFVLLSFVLNCTVSANLSFSQQQAATSDSGQYELLYKLHSEYQSKLGERLMLERILRSLNDVDSVYLVHYPTWIIQDEDIRQRVLKAFRNRGKSAPSLAPIHVVTNPARDEIVQLTILGASNMGRGEVRLYLSEGLQKAILHSVSPHSEVVSLPAVERRGVLPDSPPKDLEFDASLFGGSLRFSNGLGVEVRVGEDEIGYPFWSSGTVQYLLLLDQLKLGAVAPINSGLDESDLLGPLTILSRKLNGAPGFVAEFDQRVGDSKLEARFSTSSLSKRNSADAYPDASNLYYLHTIGQLALSHEFSLENGEYLVGLKGGLGFHQVGRGAVQIDGSITTNDKTNYFSPIVKLEYIRHGFPMYGFAVQYYSSSVLLTAWTELVKNFVYFDLKYSTPVFRAAQPWEQPYFLMASPRIRFAF